MDNRNLVPVSPSESPGGFKVESSVLIGQSRNAVVVTPNPPASNYVPGSVDYSLLYHAAGSASGTVSAQVIDPDQLPNDHVFEVSFDTTAGIDTKILIPFATNYTIRDTTSGTTLVSKSPIPLLPALKDTQAVQPFAWQKYDTLWTSNVFSGMVLNMKNVLPDTQAIRFASGWLPGSLSTSTIQILYNDNVVYPVSFKIVFDSMAIGKSFTTKLANPTSTFNTYLTIVNTVTGDTLPFHLKEGLFGAKGKLDKTGEVIYIGYRKSDGTYLWPWALTLIMFNPADLPPQPGDVYNVVCPLPFSTNDRFTFSTTASGVKRDLQSSVLDKVAVVPNPYILTALWERESSLTGRGERKVQFIHLPAECTISIYTQNGTRIRTIYHSKGMADGVESWDLTTDEGLEVAFGVYIFHIDAHDIGQKIGTFAIIN
jgi:hypothetical protein